MQIMKPCDESDVSPCESCDRLTDRARHMIEARDARIERLTRRIEILEESASLPFAPKTSDAPRHSSKSIGASVI